MYSNCACTLAQDELYLFIAILFPQHIVEGLLNSRRRVSDRPSWILISKTPARKSKIFIVCFFLFAAQAFKAELKAEPDLRYASIFKLRQIPILGTQTFLT